MVELTEKDILLYTPFWDILNVFIWTLLKRYVIINVQEKRDFTVYKFGSEPC